jgi:ribosomal protein S27AE
MREEEITCPRCGTASQLAWPMRRSADEFCERCDYPLFWAPAFADRDVDLRCPRCDHPNPAGSVYCNRCGEQVEKP